MIFETYKPEKKEQRLCIALTTTERMKLEDSANYSKKTIAEYIRHLITTNYEEITKGVA